MFQKMSPHVFDLPGGSENSDIITDFVHCRIEECIQVYQSKEETAKDIFDKFQIEPKFTRFIWFLLEKANPDFFSWFKSHREDIRNAPSKPGEEVTAIAKTTPSNVEIKTSSKPDEDLADASTSYTEPDNRLRARRFKARKAKELQKQHPISPIRCLKETAPNDASSQVPQEAATTNAADAQITVEKVSSKARRSKAQKKAKQKIQLLHASPQQQQQQAQDSPSTETTPNVERAEVLSQESIPTDDAEITMKQISTSLRQLESLIEKVHKLLSNRPPCSAVKQRSWEQVRGGYEEAEMLQDLNQELQQEMQRMDIPGNEASDIPSEEDTLYD